MKKITSAALLALHLSWKAALAIFLAALGVQSVAVFLELMPGFVPMQTTFSFEWLLESAIEPHGKTFALALMICVVLRAASSKGSKTIYTMNRLGLGEMQVTLIFGGVFSLYFLLYWVFQLALVYGIFAWYSRLSLVNSNAFMLASWRSEWLHLLLPLGEWLGYVRNAVLCLSFGFTAAFGVHRLRRGKNAVVCAAPPILCSFLLSGRIANQLELMTIVLLTACIVAIWFMTKGGADDEIL